jgi:dTDP-glucose 4,6-dehydratase
MENQFKTGDLCLLVTGAAGFIGSSFVRTMLAAYDNVRIVVLDKLTYAGNLENLATVEHNPNYRFFLGDICSRDEVQASIDFARSEFGVPVDAIVHFAAESHVDRSIENSAIFLATNVLGTDVVLNAARQNKIARIVHISTDEVYGSLGPDDAFRETTPLAPNSPYAASKASSDLIARAYHETFGLPVLITRCSNNYGPNQFPEKLIPLMIANALENRELPVYGDGLNVRDWIYVDDHSRGVDFVLRNGRVGEVYNLGGHSERTNIEVVRTLLSLLEKPESLIRYVTDRPGHDRRYAMDTAKIAQELGWSPLVSFEEGLKRTVQWFIANAEWVAKVRSGEYQSYYDRMYGKR